MHSTELTISTWMSYEPVEKNYFFGISFDGLEGLNPTLELDFIKDIREGTSVIEQYDLTKEEPDSGYFRYVLRGINDNIKMIMDAQKQKYPFKNITYDIDMQLLIED